MTQDFRTVWNNCLETIRMSTTPQSFKTWFEPIVPVKLDSNSLTIQVPNKFFYEWLEEHYVSVLRMSIKKELGMSAKLEYQIPVGRSNSSDTTENFGKQLKGKMQSGGRYRSDDTAVAEIKSPFVIPGVQRLKIESQLNVNYTFSNFIEGDCNRLARSAGLAIGKNPGKTAFNPLVVYGNVGLGKTHLCYAIGNEVAKSFPEKNVLYISCESFTSQIVQAIMNNTVNDFLHYYRHVDVLIVDDIQFLAKKIKTQEIFFHIFNQLHQTGKQLVISSDRAPKDLEGIEDRLISRFKWGLTADLQTPDLETRLGIIEHKLRKEGIEMSGEVKEFIAYTVDENIRDLEGVLISIIGNSKLTNRPIDMALAQEVLNKAVQNTENKLDIEYISKVVCETLGVDVGQLKSKSRKREFVLARQITMYLSKQMTDMSLKDIGSFFGGKDHSTVIYSCNTIKDAMDVDKKLNSSVEEIIKRIKISTL